jgi:hypothetical protein
MAEGTDFLVAFDALDETVDVGLQLGIGHVGRRQYLD